MPTLQVLGRKELGLRRDALPVRPRLLLSLRGRAQGQRWNQAVRMPRCRGAATGTRGATEPQSAAAGAPAVRPALTLVAYDLACLELALGIGILIEWRAWSGRYIHM